MNHPVENRKFDFERNYRHGFLASLRLLSLIETDFHRFFIPHTHRFIAMLRSLPRIEMDFHGFFHATIRANLSHPCIRAQQVTRVYDYEKDP